MKTAGIICEYNPFHLGHLYHIEKTKEILGNDTCVICVMSGNFVQRGDFAIFNKHARAKMAVYSGADIVIELPTPYALLSAGDFAKAGVYLLESLGVCNYISFGSESGSIDELTNAATVIISDEAQMYIREGLSIGLPYASAQQQAADCILGERSAIFNTPNNILAIEYIKALAENKSKIKPVTIARTGGEHDGNSGYSATAVRRELHHGNLPVAQMPGAAVAVSMEEMVLGRGPVCVKDAEQAILSRLRTIEDFSQYHGGADGLDRRFIKYAGKMPSLNEVLASIKTKRYAMSRIRRMLICAVLGIRSDDTKNMPAYIRILAMNKKGMETLRRLKKKAKLPVITKPASVYKQNKQVQGAFKLESSVTDFYALAYSKEENRTGGGEWRQSPVIC